MSMEIESNVEITNLLSNLLDAVRECQRQSSVTKEILTEANSCVSCLCQQFETILNHGLKKQTSSGGLSTIKQVTGIQSEPEPCFWNALEPLLTRHEIDRFSNLTHIKTDIGKGRAWLRCSLNEHSLERMLQMLLGDIIVLQQYYGPDAFLRNDEKSSVLPQAAAGLKPVVFCIKIDDVALDKIPQIPSAQLESNFALSSLSYVTNLLQPQTDVTMEEFPQASQANDSTSPALIKKNEKKKKRKKKSKIISFDKDTEGHRHSSAASSEAGSFIYDSNTESRSSRDKPSYNRMTSSPLSSFSEPSIYTENRRFSSSSRILDALPKETFKPLTASSISAKDSNYDSDDRSSLTGSVSSLSSAKNDTKRSSIEAPEHVQSTDFDDSIPSNRSTPVHESSYNIIGTTTDLSNVKSYESENMLSAALSSLKLLKEAENETNLENNVMTSSGNDLAANHPIIKKNAELQKALIALLQRKDELAEEKKHLQVLLDAEKEHSKALKMEVANLKEAAETTKQSFKQEHEKQSRENDVLRNQLKKYVGAVHALQQEQNNQPSTSKVKQEEVVSDKDAEKLASSEIEMYENKLSNVAQMHGELLEFTEKLHTRQISAISLLRKMHDELVSLRGPMPTDDLIKAIEGDLDSKVLPFSSSSVTSPIVNVWVPSVFMQGSGPEGYHVYQVYICVGEDEWNVYRRYSDFLKMHTALCKVYSQVGDYNFPPKKSVGNKSSKFVEERRKSFQKYLRLLMNNIFQENAELRASPCKSTLLHILPFFSDVGDQCRVLLSKKKK